VNILSTRRIKAQRNCKNLSLSSPVLPYFPASHLN